MMSITFKHSSGWIISHKDYLRTTYREVRSEHDVRDFNFDEYFNLPSPFTRNRHNFSDSQKVKNKRKMNDLSNEVLNVKCSFETIMKSAKEEGIFIGSFFDNKSEQSSNDESRLKANKYFETMQSLKTIVSSNIFDFPLLAKLSKCYYLIPSKASFYNDDISAITNHISCNKYDFILLDPPWYNRFVKRRKKYYPEHGYSFLDSHDLSQIPVQTLLKSSGLVAVWTTNSSSHIDAVKHILFPSWNIIWISTWYWIKVTDKGELIVPFSNDNVKQPYERLMFGCKPDRVHQNPQDGKCFLSVPSSVHSHKPPIIEILKSYLPEENNCLEIFARYLLPNWTSYGNQVLSLQLESLYQSQESSKHSVS